MSIRTIAIALICCLPSLVTTRGDDALHELVARQVQPRIDRGESVGIVVGIVREGRTEVFGFGRPSLEATHRPDGRTIFEIGSITKVFTAIALADMAEERIVTLDAPLRTLIPDAVRVPSRGGREITLRMLANHRSGLPRLIPKVIARTITGQQPYEHVDASDLYEFLAVYELKSDPGEKHLYSNFGSGLLGTALARRANTTYEELIASRICRPLDLRDTRIHLDTLQTTRLARPYNKGKKPANPWKFGAFEGAGALRSTADDMLRFVSANLGLIDVAGRLRASLAAATTPRSPADKTGVSMALGWHVFDAKTKPARPEILWHNGGTGGFSSVIAFAPSKKVGVVVLSNSDESIDSIGIAILDHLVQE
jgi:D-alanyl-D-alanine-carboxypeptidase/D-alanyl-D-alanine-endopeptidase